MGKYQKALQNIVDILAEEHRQDEVDIPPDVVIVRRANEPCSFYMFGPIHYYLFDLEDNRYRVSEEVYEKYRPFTYYKPIVWSQEKEWRDT